MKYIINFLIYLSCETYVHPTVPPNLIRVQYILYNKWGDAHEWRNHERKSLANLITKDQNIVMHGNECIIYVLHVILYSAKNNHRSLISPLSPRTAFRFLSTCSSSSSSTSSSNSNFISDSTNTSKKTCSFTCTAHKTASGHQRNYSSSSLSYLALWRHHSWSVTSRTRGTSIVMPYSSTVLARANWRKGDFY